MGHKQPLSCPRDADIAKPAFLLHAGFVIAASCRREEVFFHSHHKDIREFQTLGTVQGHHRNRAAVLAQLIQIRNQRYVFKIFRQRRIIGFLLKLLDRTNKFTDILHAGTRFVAVFLGILALKPYRVDDILNQIRQLHGLSHHRQIHHQLAEFLHVLAGAGADALRHIHARCQQRHFLLCGVLRQLRNCRVANRTLGYIDDAPHGNIVCRIDHHAQIRQNVLDLLAVIELESAVHPIANTRLHKRFFDDTGLRIRSVKHSKPACVLALRHQLPNLLTNPCRFLPLIACPIQADALTRTLLRPKCFILSVCVERNHLIGGIQNIRGRTVVLFQLDDLRIRKILFKIEDIADIRAAPAIDGLIVIADHAKVAALRSQQPNKHILRVVRILIFVYMNIAQLTLICLQNRRMLGKQLKRFDNQVIKIQ